MSDPAPTPRARVRQAAVDFIDNVLDGLQLQTSALVGNSAGGSGVVVRPCPSPPGAVLLVWGDRDPVGSMEVANALLIPDAEQAVLPAGHVPYLGHHEHVGALVSEFVRAAAAR